MIALTDDDGDADIDDGGPLAPVLYSYNNFGAPEGSDIGRFRYTGQMWISDQGADFYHYKSCSRAGICPPLSGLSGERRSRFDAAYTPMAEHSPLVPAHILTGKLAG